MPIVYKKLFSLMKIKGLTTYQIRKEKVIPESSLTKLRNGSDVKVSTISSLCKRLGCQPGDILEYVPEQIEN